MNIAQGEFMALGIYATPTVAFGATHLLGPVAAAYGGVLATAVVIPDCVPLGS